MPSRLRLSRNYRLVPTTVTRPEGELCGARVRVLEGPFAGKTGVVQELDGKGVARVLFGKLSAYVEVEALAPEPGAQRAPRASLRSSHRSRPSLPGRRLNR